MLFQMAGDPTTAVLGYGMRKQNNLSASAAAWTWTGSPQPRHSPFPTHTAELRQKGKASPKVFAFAGVLQSSPP